LKHLFLSTAVLGLISITGVEAGVTFQLGNSPQIDEPVLFHDSCVGCVDGPALLVIGHEQTSNILVDLTSDTPLTAVGPGHDTVSTDTGFSNMDLTIPGYAFSTIILQLTSLSSAADGTVTFTAHTSDGDFISDAFFDDHTGGNYFTIITTLGTAINSLDLTTTQLQHDISQIRVGDTTAVVPEPGTAGLLLLAGAGLLGIGRFRRN